MLKLIDGEGEKEMREEINQLIWQTTQMNHKNYMRHSEILHIIAPRTSWTPVDEAIYSVKDLFDVEVEKANRLRFNAVKFSFNHHYHHNRFYNSLCEQRGIKPEYIETIDDLFKIPLIPQRVFKQYPETKHFIPWLRGIGSDTIKYPNIGGASYIDIIDKLNKYGIKILFSSGTTGKSSMVPRDYEALIREAHYRVSSRRLLDYYPNMIYFGLGLDPRKLHPNWSIAHGLGGDIAVMHDKDDVYHTIDIKTNPDMIKTLMGIEKGRTQTEKRDKNETDTKPIELLEKAIKKRSNGILHGPPFKINDFLEEIEVSGKDFHLGNDWYVQTGGGGWLGLTEKQLYEKIERVLGIPDVNCRDIYAMAENTFAFPSCEGHYYHIPYTIIQPFILDDNLEVMSYGESGRWAFIDPAPTAYPGYIISEDKVKLLEHCPVCDRLGPVISPPVARMPGHEEAGCSTMMRKLMEEEVARA